MAGRGEGLSARDKTLAGSACRRETYPRLRRRAFSSQSLVAEAREWTFYQVYIPVMFSAVALLTGLNLLYILFQPVPAL